MQKSDSPSGSAADASALPPFEDAMRELEDIIGAMEGGDLSLEQSLAAYQRGARLVKHCQGALERVREQVRVLEGEELRPLDAEGAGSGSGN